VGSDWDDSTKIASKDELKQPVAKDPQRPYLIVLAGNTVGEMFKITKEETTIGRGTQADIVVTDDGISRKHAQILIQADKTIVRDLGSTNGTFCNGQKITEHVLKDGDKIQVGSTTILKFTFHDSLDENFQRQMYESALRDGLTKIFNKKYFLDRLESEFAYAQRHKTPLSLVMFDIDHFKKINDTYGHLAGDAALVALSKTVTGVIRQEDVFARYGGEEFAVISRGIDLKGAGAFGERIRKTVEASSVPHDQVLITFTVSIGVAQFNDVSMRDCMAFISKADEALYAAKRSGRNRVVMSQPPESGTF
jgi:two-component system, cell cycle response regulator